MATDSRSPTSDEATTAGTWTGSAGTRYTLVDDHPDATGADKLTLSGSGSGNLTFGFTAFSIPAGSTALSVQVIYYDDKNASQGCNVGGRLKVGGNYYGATTHNPANGVFTLRTDDWANNPKTATAWTVDDVNGVGANALQAFGWVSTDTAPSIDLTSVIVQVTYTPAPSSVTLAGTSAGVAAVSGGISATRGLVSSSGGVSTVAGAIKVDLTLAGASAGVSTPSGSLAALRTLAGTSAGLSAPAGQITLGLSLASSSAGVSTVAAALTVTGAGQSVLLAGASAGSGAPTAAVSVLYQLGGVSAGVGAPTGSLSIFRGLAGVSAGSSVTAGSVVLTQGLVGSSAGVAAVAGIITRTLVLAGLSAGVGAGIGELTVSETGPPTTIGKALASVVPGLRARAIASVSPSLPKARASVLSLAGTARAVVVTAMNFVVDGTASFKVEFWNASGSKADPTTLTLYCICPSELHTYVYGTDNEVVKDATGEYHADITLTEAGTVHWEWVAAGALVAKAKGEFGVQEL